MSFIEEGLLLVAFVVDDESVKEALCRSIPYVYKRTDQIFTKYRAIYISENEQVERAGSLIHSFGENPAVTITDPVTDKIYEKRWFYLGKMYKKIRFQL